MFHASGLQPFRAVSVVLLAENPRPGTLENEILTTGAADFGFR